MAVGLFAQLGTRSDASFSDLAAKADTARQADRLDEAAALYRQALRLRPAWIEGWWYLGTLLYDRDDFAGAATALGKAAELGPKDGNGFALLGLSEAKLNRKTEALKHLDQALALGIGQDSGVRPVVLFTRANLLLSAGEFGKAQDALGALVRQGFHEPELVLALGESVLGIRPADPSLTNTEMRQAVEQAGEAEQLAAKRDVHAALASYERLATGFPKMHNVQFAYGRFLLANHQDEQAVAAFRREIENTPLHLLARLGIAGTLLSTDPAPALQYAQEAVRMAPGLEEAHYLLGALLLATGAADAAVPELETACRQDPKDARVYFLLDRAYTRTQRPKDAARARAAFTRLNQSKPE